MMLLKKTVYDNLVTKVNDIDTRKFLLNKKSHRQIGDGRKNS